MYSIASCVKLCSCTVLRCPVVAVCYRECFPLGVYKTHTVHIYCGVPIPCWIEWLDPWTRLNADRSRLKIGIILLSPLPVVSYKIYIFFCGLRPFHFCVDRFPIERIVSGALATGICVFIACSIEYIRPGLHSSGLQGTPCCGLGLLANLFGVRPTPLNMVCMI